MARLVRIECEQRAQVGRNLIDQRTGVAAFFHRGENTVFELGLFKNRRMLSRSDVSTITVKFFNSDYELILTQFIPNSNMSSGLTAAQWRTGNACLARLQIVGADTGGLPSGFFTMEVWVNEFGLDSIFASGLIEGVTIPTITTTAFDPPGPSEYWTKEEADARFDLNGSGSAAMDLAEQLQTYTGYTPGDPDPGAFVRYSGQSLIDSEKLTARQNINAAVNGGLVTIIGESSGTGNSNAIPDGRSAGIITVTPSGNSAIELRAPVLAAGIRCRLRIQQGFKAKWTSDYTFPAFALTVGASSGGFAKETWHPATGEGYDSFDLFYDGSTTHVSRARSVPLPLPVTDWVPESPLVAVNGSNVFTVFRDRYGSSSAVAGAPGLGTMAGSVFPAFSYDGVDDAHGWFTEPFVTAAGMALAMVFTAVSSTSQKCLFYSTALGIQLVADTDGIRLQAAGAASGTGLLISASYSAKPVAFVAVIRPGSAGAYVLTTDPTGGGQTGSFAAAAGVAGGYAHMGADGPVSARYLACKVGRCQIYRSGLSPDQARAVLDSLTQYYQLG